MQASTTNIMSISDRTFIINTLLSNITFTKTGLQLLEAQDEGERENMTKGNGEQMGTARNHWENIVSRTEWEVGRWRKV
jgi:hypothetical protein